MIKLSLKLVSIRKNIRILRLQNKNTIDMMQKLSSLLVAALLLLMGACSNDVLDLSTDTTTNNTNAPRGFVSMDQAKARLANIVNQLNSQTSDASQPFPAVTPSRLTGVALGADMKPLTRADDQTQAGCYLLRMDNDMFAIMSATDNRPELLAIGSGYPNFEDSTALVPNPGYWDPIVPMDTLPHVNEQRDSVFTKIIKTEYEYLAENLCPVKWGNKYPYNNRVRMLPTGNFNPITGEPMLAHAAVGCVAVACAQIMLAPNLRGGYYKEHTFDWDALAQCRYASSFSPISSEVHQVATLFEDLTNEENINPSTWGLGVTWANPSNIIHTLEHFHFKNPGKGPYAFNLDTVKSELLQGYPLYFSAYGGVDSVKMLGGHAWVCHGLMKAKITIGVYASHNILEQPELIDQKEETAWYLQMNWGWDSKGDGYYLAKFNDFLNNIKGPDVPEDGTSPTAGQNIYFPNTTGIIYGFRFR